MTQPHFELRQSFRKFPLHRQVGIYNRVFGLFFFWGSKSMKISAQTQHLADISRVFFFFARILGISRASPWDLSNRFQCPTLASSAPGFHVGFQVQLGLMKMGLSVPTRVQDMTLPMLLEGAQLKKAWGAAFFGNDHCDVLKLPAAYFLRSCWKNLFPSFCWVQLIFPGRQKESLNLDVSEILHRAYESPQLEILAFWIMVFEFQPSKSDGPHWEAAAPTSRVIVLEARTYRLKRDIYHKNMLMEEILHHPCK